MMRLLYHATNLLFSVALLYTSTLSAIETGQAAPACLLTALDNNQNITLKNAENRILYVDFWASWCPPCAKSFPFMNALTHDLKNQGLDIVAINLDENPEDAQQFLNKYPAHFPLVSDQDNACAKAFDVKAMPSSYLIDSNGTVRHIHLGFRKGEATQLRAKIEQLLAESSKQTTSP